MGYANKTINKDIWQCMPVQFQDCASEGRTIPVAKYLSVADMTPGYINEDDDIIDAPQIQLPNENAGANYTKYYYLNNAKDANKNTVTAWANGSGRAVTDANVLTLGKAFWFRGCNDGATATGSGKVMAGDDATITVKADVWQMIANPFPMEADLQKVITTGITPGYINEDDDMVDAPQIQVPNENVGANYTKYYYINNAKDENKNTVTAWANGSGKAVNTVIPAMRGAWYKGATGGSITFVK